MKVRNTGNVYFPNLDGLRFFAFALVFLQHAFGKIFAGIESIPFFNKIIWFIFLNGGTGVSVFFVLSGFLITYLLITEISINGKLDIKSFYIRRALRIWPLYFSVVFFAFDIYPYLKSFIGIYSDICSRPIYFYLFLANFDVIHINESCPGQDSMMQNITWSVAIEEQFYLIWPLFFLLISKERLVYLFYIVILISIIFRALNIDNNNALYFHTLSVCGDLAVGGLGAYYAIYSTKFKVFFTRVPPKFISLIYVIGFLYCVFAGDFNLIYFGVYNRLIASLFFLFIILEQNFNTLSGFKFCKLKLISTAGKYTYGYYLLHPIAIMLVYNSYRIAGIKVEGWVNLTISGIIALIITFIISYFSYNFFEIYFIRMKHKYSYIQKG